METQITKQSTAVANARLVKEAQSLTGEGEGNFIPFIPIIRVDNKKESKTVMIDGKEKKIKILPDAGFIITKKNKDTGKLDILKFSENLEAVILRVRYRIQEKYDKINPNKKSYYSYEFDMMDQNIKVYNGDTKKEMVCGSYQELKEKFKTGESESGFPTKSFDLMMILYIDLDGEIYRFERKVTRNDEWYNYRNKFARDDTFVAYKTKFLLKKATAGDNEYWNLFFEKGESIDLAKEIALQKEISKFFRVATTIRETSKEELPVIQVEDTDHIEAPQMSDEEIAAIPF